MEKYQKILVVIDPNNEQQKALQRAIELAEHTNAEITAFLCIYDFSYEMTTMLSMDERELMRASVTQSRLEWLEAIISAASRSIIKIKVTWHHRPFESIIEHVISEGYDLVIKATHEHNKLKAIIFTPTDWHLLRKCPCPVLLVKDHSWPINGNIIAAVNVGNSEPEQCSLNKKVTEEALNLSKIIKANTHLVNAYPSQTMSLAIEVPEFDIAQYNETIKKHHIEAMEKHCELYPIRVDKTYIREGLPENVIAELSEEIDAELVILGTIGRTGLSATLIGNTAEHTIDNLNCDVLALKPDGYVSPLQS